MITSAGRYWRQVTTVLLGSATAQAIPILASLVLARLLVPREFGVYAAWLGVVSLAAVGLTLRLEQALSLEADGAGRGAVARAALVSVLFFLVGAGLPTIALLAAFGPPEASGELLALGLFASGAIAATQVWQMWIAAEGRYVALGAVRITQALALSGSQIALCLLSPTFASLALGHALGVVLGLVIAIRLQPLARSPAGRWLDVAEVKKVLTRHHRLPRYSLASDAISAGAAQLPLLLVAHRFGAESAGLFSLAMRTLAAPAALLGAAVLDVFRRESAAAFRARGECRAEYRQTFVVLFLGALLFSLVLAPWSEQIFATAFGEPWRLSGAVALWLLPLVAIRFVVSPLSHLIYVANKQVHDLVWQCALLAVTVVALHLGSTFQMGILSYVAAASALYLVYLLMTYRFSGGPQP